MRHRKMLLAATIVTALTSASCTSARWYRGNLHTHSLWSDGDGFPEMIAAWYAENGYDFLALSDHDILSRGERWMRLSEIEKRGGEGALAAYRTKFGDAWVETRGDGDALEVRLKPLDEFRPLIEEPGRFLMIEGEEITDHFEKLPVHLNATNLAELIRPQGGTSVQDVMRRNLVAAKEQAERLDRPILTHLNHPNFGFAVSAEDLAAVLEERFFEVFNGHPAVRQLGDATRPSVERIWDIANTLRLRVAKAPPLYGLATDDSHDYHGLDGARPGRGWIRVRAESLDAAALIAAIERGDFYASTGVTLRGVSFDGETLAIEIHAEPGVSYTTRFIASLEDVDIASEPVTDAAGTVVARRYSDEIGRVLTTVEGARPSYRLSGKELYVRAIVDASAPVERPVFEGQKKQAWTQPVGWESRVAASSAGE